MQHFIQHLFEDLERQLSDLHAKVKDPYLHSAEALAVLCPALQELNREADKKGFSTEAEEIDYFKRQRPALLAKIIYYNTVHHFEAEGGKGRRGRRELAQKELERLGGFRALHVGFYRYYRTGDTSLDRHYFLRSAHDVKLVSDPYLFSCDIRSSTTYDFIAGRLMAQDMLEIYLEEVIATSKRDSATPAVSGLKWTGPKVALVELLYALHTEGVFDNGKAELSAIAAGFETAFNVQLGQVHRVFIDIRARKSERTRFLDALKKGLVERMDGADEVA